MKSYEHIVSKQIEWAYNHKIALIGSAGNHGRLAYTRCVEDNLFEPLSPANDRAFREGDGSELAGTPAKMQAVHSSAALAVNIFQFWDSVNESHVIAHACRFCKKSTKISRNIAFEVKYPIYDSFHYAPNVDVVIENLPDSQYQVYAIESKFSEAYSGYSHSGMKTKYLDLDVWGELPHLHELALSISPHDDRFQHLHAAQLIKHILGLKRAYAQDGFRLLYLWYDALGSEGARHQEEIQQFLETANADGIAVHELSYQKLIAWLAEHYRATHRHYIEYITDRYL